MKYHHILFDWGNTLMEDLPGMRGPMVKWPNVVAVSGAVNTLQILSERIPCHIATNANESSEIEIREALDRVGLGHFITEIFCFNRIGSRKPDPDFYHTITSTLGDEPEHVLMVGDSLANDVIAAIEAGLHAIWLNRFKQPCPSDIPMVTCLEELPALILD